MSYEQKTTHCSFSTYVDEKQGWEMRDHRNYKAFKLADDLCIFIYVATRDFPREEIYGLTSQLRRAAVSVVSNFVEGCGRHTEADFLRFLDISFGSIREVEYQVSLAKRLGYLSDPQLSNLEAKLDEAIKVLRGLIVSMRS